MQQLAGIGASIVVIVGLALVSCGNARYLGHGSGGEDDAAGDPSTGEGTGSEAACEELGADCGSGCCAGLTCKCGTCQYLDEGDDSGGFVPEGDVPIVAMCDIWNPEDCPEGEKCTAYATAGSSWDANKCVTIQGDAMPGEPCVSTDGSGVSGNDTCAKGSMCWDIGIDTMVGYCVAFCAGSPENPSCANGSLCTMYGNGVLPQCIPTCDPLDGGDDCPNPKNLCVSSPGGLGFVCILDASGGEGTYGTECQYVNSCNSGLFCANADAVPDCQGAQGCCSEFCSLGEPSTCAGKDGGQECVPWFEHPPPGYEHVGGCGIPE